MELIKLHPDYSSGGIATHRTWENFGVGKIGEFGELWAIRQYFTRQLFLLDYSS